MTNFSLFNSHVRGDLFTENGKWKYTVVIDMSNVQYDNPFVQNMVVEALRTTPSNIRGVVDEAVGKDSKYYLVVLNPHNKYSHPQMIKLSYFK